MKLLNIVMVLLLSVALVPSTGLADWADEPEAEMDRNPDDEGAAPTEAAAATTATKETTATTATKGAKPAAATATKATKTTTTTTTTTPAAKPAGHPAGHPAPKTK